MQYFIDTNLIIDFLNQKEQATKIIMKIMLSENDDIVTNRLRL